jgi:hypothetical protein
MTERVYSQTPWEDIGHGVSIERRLVDGVLGGVAYRHPRPKTGETCEGYVPVTGWDEVWQVVSLEPLTLSPSLLCRGCGHHGFVREGRWVPA